MVLIFVWTFDAFFNAVDDTAQLSNGSRGVERVMPVLVLMHRLGNPVGGFLNAVEVAIVGGMDHREVFSFKLLSEFPWCPFDVSLIKDFLNLV